jgi:hypothetical protein
MSHFPDMGTVTMVAAGPHVRAVGWLDPDHPFPQGDAPRGSLNKLQQFVEHADQIGFALGLPRFLGPHSCEFCSDAMGFANFGVPSGELLFVAPVLIHHYVSCHRYLPPAEFLSAVLTSPPPGSAEHGRLLSRFAHRPISSEDAERIGAAIRDWKRRVVAAHQRQRGTDTQS